MQVELVANPPAGEISSQRCPELCAAQVGTPSCESVVALFVCGDIKNRLGSVLFPPAAKNCVWFSWICSNDRSG